jgi:hypothetical protein
VRHQESKPAYCQLLLRLRIIPAGLQLPIILNYICKSKKKYMALTYADIELINADDLALARKYIIGEDEVKPILIIK